MKMQRGFTLIEIMIAVAILSILGAIAFQTYAGYLSRGKIAEAHATLTSARVRVEQYYQDNRTYVGAPCPAASTYFTYTCAFAANTYTIRADNLANVAKTGSYAYTINESNVRATLAFLAGKTSKTSATEWITK